MLCVNCESAQGLGIEHICEDSHTCTCEDREHCWRDTDDQGRAIYPST